MLFLLSNGATYLILAGIMALVAYAALTRMDEISGPAHDLEQRFKWKWLVPVPRELRLRMTKTGRGRRFAPALFASCAAEYEARLTERLKRISPEDGGRGAA